MVSCLPVQTFLDLPVFKCTCKRSLISEKLTFNQFPWDCAQLIVIKGSFLHLLELWIAWANSSLPVPLSPCINTFEELSAAIFASLIHSLNLSSFPIISSKVNFCISTYHIVLPFLHSLYLSKGIYYANEFTVFISNRYCRLNKMYCILCIFNYELLST